MKLSYSLLAFTVFVAGPAAAADIDARSEIGGVTVYPSGAEITRTAKVKLEKGDHVLIFRDLPAGAIEGSIRVEGHATGKLEIGSVDTRRAFVPRDDAAASQSERRRLETEIEQKKDEKTLVQAEIEAAETQKQLIQNLSQLPNRPAPVQGAEKSEDWGSVLGVIASATTDAEKRRHEAEVKIREIDRKITDLENALAALAPEQVERTEAKVFVAAQSALEADVTIRYQVADASWTPIYDVRLETGGKTTPPSFALTRRASISQNTGEPWSKIALILSTTRPAAGASAPELNPVRVDIEQPPPPRPVAAAPMVSAAPEAVGAVADAEDAVKMEVGASVRRRELKLAAAMKPADVVTAPFHALFTVPGAVSVPDTGETKRVELQSETIEPELSLRTVPKQDAKAYLYAKFVLPKGSPLLPGEVSLFRDGTFVGTGRLPILSPGEDHELGFGSDDLVRVRYAIQEEKRGETGLISTSRTDVRNYRITVKSMHERPIAVSVFDQLPVSENQDIKVELNAKTAPTRQNVDDKRGILAWDSTLQPDQEQVVEFGYRVTWPSGKNVVYR